VFFSAPQQWDIVYGLFPYPPEFSEPGPEPHYCLVLDVFEDQATGEPWVIVAFGTSQHTDDLRSGEFLVNRRHRPDQGSGLNKPTKFSVARNRLAKLPYNDQFFAPPPSRRSAGQKDPLVGRLSASTYIKPLQAAAAGSDAASSIKELTSLQLGILPPK